VNRESHWHHRHTGNPTVQPLQQAASLPCGACEIDARNAPVMSVRFESSNRHDDLRQHADGALHRDVDVVRPPMFCPTPRNPIRPNSARRCGSGQRVLSIVVGDLLVADPGCARDPAQMVTRCRRNRPETSISCGSGNGARTTSANSTLIPTHEGTLTLSHVFMRRPHHAVFAWPSAVLRSARDTS